MDRIGLTFEEYTELKVRPRVGADAAFQHAAEMELERMFPMTLMVASSHLRSRGYDCRPQMLEVLVRDQVVKPAGPDAWSQVDVVDDQHNQADTALNMTDRLQSRYGGAASILWRSGGIGLQWAVVRFASLEQIVLNDVDVDDEITDGRVVEVGLKWKTPTSRTIVPFVNEKYNQLVDPAIQSGDKVKVSLSYDGILQRIVPTVDDSGIPDEIDVSQMVQASEYADPESKLVEVEFDATAAANGKLKLQIDDTAVAAAIAGIAPGGAEIAVAAQSPPVSRIITCALGGESVSVYNIDGRNWNEYPGFDAGQQVTGLAPPIAAGRLRLCRHTAEPIPAVLSRVLLHRHRPRRVRHSQPDGRIFAFVQHLRLHRECAHGRWLSLEHQVSWHRDRHAGGRGPRQRCPRICRASGICRCEHRAGCRSREGHRQSAAVGKPIRPASRHQREHHRARPRRQLVGGVSRGQDGRLLLGCPSRDRSRRVVRIPVVRLPRGRGGSLMPETVTGYIDPTTGQLVFDEEVEGEIVQRIAKADPDTGRLYIMYSGEKLRITADPADGRLKINVQAQPMIFLQVTVPEFVVSGESFEITIEAFSHGWSYEDGIPQPVPDYAGDCTLSLDDAAYSVEPTTIAAGEWTGGKVAKEITVTTEVAGESTANLHVQSDANAEHAGSATLTVFHEAPPIAFDVQGSVWQLTPQNGETAWFTLKAIARQLGKMLPGYDEKCSVSSSVGTVVIQNRATPHIEPEDWQNGLATVTMKLTDIPTPSSHAVITVAEVAEPAHQGQTTLLLKVPEHTRSAWRMVYGNALAEFVYSDSHPWDADHRRILYERHTPERWYSVLNATRNLAEGSTYYTIPSGYYGMEFGYSIATAQGWYSPGYPMRYGRMMAREDWTAYVWDLQPYIGQSLNYLLEIGELQAEPASNAETWAPIVYKPGTPGWYEHDWNNTSQQPMPNWTVSFRYDFWDAPRES